MNEAIKALKAGDKQRAFALLRRYLAENPKDANAWLWMSEATTNPKQQVDALRRVLTLAPQHPHALSIHQRLEALTKEPSPPPADKISQQLGTMPPAPQVPPTPPSPSTLEEPIEPIKKAPPTMPAKEKPATFIDEPPFEQLQQRIGFREESKSKDESISSPPSAHETLADLRQSLLTTLIVEEKQEKSKAASADSQPKPPAPDEGLPRWVWFVILLVIVVLAIFLVATYLMVQSSN